MPRVERLELVEVLGRAGVDLGGPPRLGPGERVADLRDRELDVARVVPPVRVEARGLGPGRLARQRDRPPGARVERGRRAAGVLDDVAHPRVELVARGDHELRARRRLDVLRPRLVVVRVGVGLEDLVDVDRVAADVAHDVAELRRGHDDVDGAGLGGRRRPAPGGEDDDGEQREEEQRAAHKMRMSLITSRRARRAITDPHGPAARRLLASGRAPPPLRVDDPRAVLLRDPVRAGRPAQLRRVRAAVAGGVRRLARHGHRDRVAVVPGLRRARSRSSAARSTASGSAGR